MRYAKDHKARTRAQVVETAGRMLRRDGIDGVGIVGLMNGVGLTKGGFYAHFASKDALVAEALDAAMATSAAATRTALDAAEADGASRLATIVDRYLRPEHVAARDLGCVFGSLMSDLARGPDGLRDTASGGAARLATLIETALPAALGAERPARAQAILATMIGSLQLARLEAEPAAIDAILAAGRRAAQLIADAGDPRTG